MFFCRAGNSIIVGLWAHWIFPRDWWLHFHFRSYVFFDIVFNFQPSQVPQIVCRGDGGSHRSPHCSMLTIQ